MATQEVVGGLVKLSAVSCEIQAIVRSLKPMVEEMLNRSFSVFHAISYRSQLVAGQNYFVKVVVGDGDDYIHIRVLEPLPHTGEQPSLHKIESDKKLFDEISYFSESPHTQGTTCSSLC
ncbi:cystatin-B-like [Mustelus asterias]